MKISVVPYGYIYTSSKALPQLTDVHTLVYNIFSLIIQNGLNPLCVASQEGYTDVVDILVKAGADVHQTSTEVLN